MSKMTSAVVVTLALAGSAHATVVFSNTFDNGFFTPFSSSTAAGVRYGDSGWFGGGSDAPIGLTGITLGLAMANSTREGSADVRFTFHDGDPSGLVFGSAAQLFSTTVRVTLPDAAENGGPVFFNLSIPLTGVSTLGGFNNVGWSVSVSNFDSDGQFGFQCSSGFGQTAGYYTNNASWYNGTNWSLFSFGSGAFGVANFVAELQAVPAPGAVASLAALGLAAGRRRRR
jgi:hypothetical protein